MSTAPFRQDMRSLQFAPFSTTPCCLPDSGDHSSLPFIITIVLLLFLFYFPFVVSLGLPSACVIICGPRKAPEFATFGLNRGKGKSAWLPPLTWCVLFPVCSSSGKSAGRQPWPSRGRTCIQVLLHPVTRTSIQGTRNGPTLLERDYPSRRKTRNLLAK